MITNDTIFNKYNKYIYIYTYYICRHRPLREADIIPVPNTIMLAAWVSSNQRNEKYRWNVTVLQVWSLIVS